MAGIKKGDGVSAPENLTSVFASATICATSNERDDRGKVTRRGNAQRAAEAGIAAVPAAVKNTRERQGRTGRKSPQVAFDGYARYSGSLWKKAETAFWLNLLIWTKMAMKLLMLPMA